MTNTPREAIIVDANGMPIGHMNIDQMHADACRLVYELAVTAGDDDATDTVSERWLTTTRDLDYFGYLTAAALPMMVRDILGPILDACDVAGIHLRPGLQAAAQDALRTLGGTQ